MTADIPCHGDRVLRVVVRAAGGLVVRRGADDTARVLLVHRLSHGDWCFPMGRQERGEALVGTALRHVRELTGLLCIADEVAGVVEDLDGRGRSKLVRYWTMRRVAGAFTPTDEVDAMAWVRPAEAMLRLSHEHDRRLLADAAERLAAVLERLGPAERSLSLG